MPCEICRQVAKALSPELGYRVPEYYDPNDNRFVKLSSWKALRRNTDCATCTRIVHFFLIDIQKNDHDAAFEDYNYELWDSTHYQTLGLQSDSKAFWPSFSISPLAEGCSERAGAVVNQHWVDIDRAIHWIRTCDTTHDKCHRPFLGSNETFSRDAIYLISVSEGCLVQAKAEDKYVALSYVWGSLSGGLKCTLAKLDSLRSKGSLKEKHDSQRLPGTIQRAMKFTSQLGFDLLWVDCLCIIQDDPVHSATQINNMSSIYSNACLTICAADGNDADSGLRGVAGSSKRRDIQQEILSFADGPATTEWVKRMHGRAVYDERGWTFQESVLSRRVIVFTEHGLEWRCQETAAQEQDHHIRETASTYSDLSLAREDTKWACLKKWDNLLSAYLSRKLTYDNDILRAFSGICSALAGSMSGGFLYGLPQEFFDVSLLWIPTEYLVRRKDPNHNFPSWSWCGWVGGIQNRINAFGLGHERSNLVSDYNARERDIVPLTTFYKIKCEEGGEGKLVKIPNNYAEYQKEGLQGTIVLPFGWSSYRDAGDDLFYYRYDRAPSSQTFWYPIPMIRESQPLDESQWDSCIFFKSMGSKLLIGSPLHQEMEDDDETAYPLYSLETEAGQWAGVVYVHEDPGDTIERAVWCSLVLISGGFAFESVEYQWMAEWDDERRPREGDVYHFYHCLWVEWRGHIAHRKGLARVPRQVWDDLDKENVNVFLA